MDNVFNGFSTMRKIIQLFNNFTVFKHTHKNARIVNSYQKVLLGSFSEDVKMWPSHNVLNWYTGNPRLTQFRLAQTLVNTV